MSHSIATRVAIAALALLIPALVMADAPCCSEESFDGVGVSPDGVFIQLVAVKRIGPDDVRVSWTIRNSTAKPQRLTKGGKGWSDPFHLSYDASLLDTSSRIAFHVTKNTKGNLLAARHPTAGPTAGIVLPANKTLTTWAQFSVPASTSKVTVTLPGAPLPWDAVAITP